MTTIQSFTQLRQHISQYEPVRLAVAGGNDERVLQAIVEAFQDGFIKHAIITGDATFIVNNWPTDMLVQVTIVSAEDAVACSTKAVKYARSGDADVLMKGSVDSTAFLKAVVNKECGIRKSEVLSNITVASMPSTPKLLAATDNGIIPAPDFDQKRHIILNTKSLYDGLGYETVKVAVIAATEKVSEKLPATVDAARLTTLSVDGKLPGFIVDGPFGYDVAVSSDAAATKKLSSSPVTGIADLLLFPNIEAANSVAKSWKYHGQAETGSIVLGASVPVLLNSRSDSVPRRINALMLAIAECMGRGAKP